jgi:RNase P subunit Pop3
VAMSEDGRRKLICSCCGATFRSSPGALTNPLLSVSSTPMASSPAKGAGITKPTIKEQEKKRKTVFRQILDTPFNVPWFEHLVRNSNVKALPRSPNKHRTCRRSLQVITLHFQAHASVLSPLSKHQSQENVPSEKPVPAAEPDFVTIGFNDTTQHLEAEIRKETDRHLRAVFVARGDTSSSQLYAHFPMMAAMLPNLRLVSFAKGAEASLCEALSMTRVGVIGLMVRKLCLCKRY